MHNCFNVSMWLNLPIRMSMRVCIYMCTYAIMDVFT